MMIKDHPDIKLNSIIEVVEREKPHQLHKKTKSKISAHMVAFRKNLDLAGRFAWHAHYSRDNHGFKWILLVIDVFTRQRYAESMKPKEKDSVLSAF